MSDFYFWLLIGCFSFTTCIFVINIGLRDVKLAFSLAMFARYGDYWGQFSMDFSYVMHVL